jgi:DNA-binding SARP family transcriptional activator
LVRAAIATFAGDDALWRSMAALAPLNPTVLASARVFAGLEFLILGPLEIRAEGRALPIGATKQRAVLALLLLNANEVVSAERLVEELWGERPPATASHSVQVYVSQLRKLLTRSGTPGAEVIVSHPSGYALRVAPEQFDLRRFEGLSEEAEQARAVGDVGIAADLLREALALWRGRALADLLDESFIQTSAARLEEIRVAVVERRIEADLQLGRHSDLIGELDELVAEHPLRERLHGQLMLALYRSGRQAEALDAYRKVRRRLSEELGLDPSVALQQLERSILQQDPALEHAALASDRASTPVANGRSILVLDLEDRALERLLALAEPLARLPPRDLILTAFVAEAGRLQRAVARVHERRADLLDRGLSVRAAAFTSATPGADAVRLVSQQEVELLLVAGSDALLADVDGSSELGIVLDQAACHVGVLFGHSSAAAGDGAVVVPFGGAEDDWAAVELGAWLARGRGISLKLLGTAGDRGGSERDASRLLASASLAVQRVTGIPAEPCLVPDGLGPLLAAAEDAFALVVGLSRRWRREGIGPMRLALAQKASAPTLFVRSSLRPGGLAPQESLTRYTWSLAAGY